MFALVIERDPLKLEQLPAYFQNWVMAAGGFAALGLAVWLVYFLLRGGGPHKTESPVGWPARILLILGLGLVLAWLPVGLRIVWNRLGWSDETAGLSYGRMAWYRPAQEHLALPPQELGLEYAAACAVAAALLPVLLNLGRVRWRRVWALARLSFKEAIRRRVLWGFSALVLVFLFASWFLPYKPEDQVRNYVRTVYWAMTPLLLVTAAVLASFSIPADVKSQTIHTIVTKPVERFEIVLGRFLGYTMLMTLVLAVMSALSLAYVARGVDEEAKEESLKARKPVYGTLAVVNAKNVGKVWDYRQYITGGAADEEAIWTFSRLPRELAERRDSVRCEFTFDIFRTTKGEENKGIFATFVFENPKWQPANLDAYNRERDQAQAQPDSELEARARRENWSAEKRRAVLLNGLAEKFGYYELPSKEIVSYHTLAVDVPAGLFQGVEDLQRTSRAPALRVTVRCESPTQYLGVAKYDLYLLASDQSEGADLAGFGLNFFKGAVGLWFRLCLVIGLGVACSTYLSGVISFLCCMFLYVSGLFLDFIRQVAEGKTIGGGPLENALRLGTGAHPVTPLDPSPVVAVLKQADVGFERLVGGFLNMIPDVDRFDLTDHVANGFDISPVQLLTVGLLLVAYLLPWLVLAFYLIRSREVASS